MEISDFARAAAQLLGLRIIHDPRAAGTLALVRSPYPMYLGMIAYVHCEILKGPDFTEADWVELFTQLWPGIEN
jgi:hypothetical protein